MKWNLIIALAVAVPFIIFIIVLSVHKIIGVNNRLTTEINGHSVEVRTGDGFAMLTIDGKTVDQIRLFYKFTQKMQGTVGDAEIVVEIRQVFEGYRITTCVDGIKNEELSNQ